MTDKYEPQLLSTCLGGPSYIGTDNRPGRRDHGRTGIARSTDKQGSFRSADSKETQQSPVLMHGMPVSQVSHHRFRDYFPLIRTYRLKCDRTYPCDRCTRRGEAASCTFVGHGPRGRASEGGSSPTHIQNRIQHLENLVLSFAQQRRQRDGASPYASVTRKPNGSSLADPEAYVEDELVDLTSSTKASHIDKTLEDDPGKIVNEEDVGISYVDASHWRAILDDVRMLCSQRLIAIQLTLSRSKK
jgi:hypothetical protein